jgi:hypothetical protein
MSPLQQRWDVHKLDSCAWLQLLVAWRCMLDVVLTAARHL